MSASVRLPRTVWVLGLVSLLTDLASDMIFPLLPAFLTGVLGASAVKLGLIEGVAEGTSAFVKLVSGRLSDRLGRRKGLVVAGYGVSSLAKPLIALATAPWHVLVVRFTDRLGKGVRSAPRDALIAEAASPETRGRAFGLHRALDTAGAILGPLVALGVLALVPGGYRLLFGLAAVPGVLAVLLLVLFVRDRGAPASHAPPTPARPTRGLGRPFWQLLAVVGLFTLGNSSDAFPLLRAQELGIPPERLPLVWLVFNVLYAVVAWRAGGWSDRVGRRRVLVAGFLLYGLVYAGFALAETPLHAWAAFLGYGVYYGLTEGVLRAAVADLVPAERRGTAFGVYFALTGTLLLGASVWAGWLWDHVGPHAPFVWGAVVSVAAAALAMAWAPGRRDGG